jgi:Domain of unknown function (DUF4116)
MAEQQGASVERTAPQPSRHAWALERHGHLLAKALRKDNSAEARAVEQLPESQIPARIVSLILEKADPTQNKGMTAWLVGQYAQGRLRLEDLGTANETLAMFRRYAQRLEISQRDLGQYQSLAAVWETVIGFANAEEQQISGKAQKALDRDKAYAESRILRQDEDGFTIAVPLTEFAAKWWGRGTRWCTAAEKDNRFWQYHEDAPLIVIVIPELGDRGKFQLWVARDEFEFMDAVDRPVSGYLEELSAQYWPRFERVIVHALRQNGLVLGYIPEALLTEEMCRIAVAQDGLALRTVPQYLRTKELYEIAAAQHGGALYDVPEKLRTEELCRIAVTQNGRALEYIPRVLRTAEICRLALAQNGAALEFVPQNIRTEDICKNAVAQNGAALEYVPEHLRNEDLCRIAVAQDGWALTYVPKALWTEDLCRMAMTHKDGLALLSLPEAMRTEEFCKLAVARNGRVLEFVPEKLRTEEMCRIAVAQHGAALEYVPEHLRTDDMCRIAVAHDGYVLQYVPQNLRTEDMCRIAVIQNSGALREVPETLRERVKARIPEPMTAWDLSLLTDLADVLKAAPSSNLAGLDYA